jgi:hypothetical protein
MWRRRFERLSSETRGSDSAGAPARSGPAREKPVAAFAAQPHLLGTLPVAIELCETEQATDEDMGWWYLYRFRAPFEHRQGADGWLTALAGPLPIPGDPHSAVPGYVATRLERLDARSVGDHFAKLAAVCEPFPIARACRE